MAKWKVSFLLFCFPLVCYSQGKSIWNQLRVTSGKFTSYPLTVKQAEKAGWKKDVTCSDQAASADLSLVPRVFSTSQNGGRENPLPTSRQYEIFRGEDPGDEVAVVLFMTLTLKNVSVLISILCCSNFFCGNRYIKADDDDATRLIFDCAGSLAGMQANALPIFLLFSEQTSSLIDFGWGGPFDVPSNEWEKLHPSVLARFLMPESTSGCLTNYSTVSVQHVYFVDPLKITCP